MEKFICKFCGKEFDSSAKLGGHIIHCKLNPNYEKNLKICTNNINKHNCKVEKDNTVYYCKFCNKPCVGKNSLVQHEIRCKENPNKIKRRCNFNYPGKVIWNKGLNKETDKRVKKGYETRRKNYIDGKFKNWSEGLTKETDARIKNSSIKIQNTICEKIKNDEWHNSYNLSYAYKNYLFDSSWEVLFAKFLDEHNILWIRNNKISFDYIYENSMHKYYPDFYLPDYDLYIEIKGLYTDKDICKWESFTKNIDIYDSKDLYELKILESFDKRNLIPNELRKKHLDLSSFL